MRQALAVALFAVAGAGLTVYVAVIGGDTAEASGSVLWPYPWIGWIVVPTVVAFCAGVVLSMRVPTAAEPTPVAASTGGELRVATPWHTYGDLQAHPNIQTGERTIKWTSNRAVAGTLRPEGRGFRAFGVEGMDLGYVETEREGVDLIERWAGGPPVAGS